MSHTVVEKRKLLNRVRRIRGQVEAVERDLSEESDCAAVLHSIAACRGAMDALMAEVIEGHIRSHILGAGTKANSQRGADELISALRAYLR
jgi:DNA-binding FrmR family transcriptional regulator